METMKTQEKAENILWPYFKSTFKRTLRDYFSPVANLKYIFAGDHEKKSDPDQGKNTPPSP